ncbi:MAG: methionine gamma-lyase family protein [Selenomonadales bacterium]|nr:methionine gamma-lyase family protein [Selenomonadales bacterium]
MECFSNKIIEAREEALRQVKGMFADVDRIAEVNTLKVLNALRKHRISSYHFSTSSGYAYNDAGREKLDELWADICGAEKALFRSQFVSGTHALATALFAFLRPGDTLLAVTGEPYDTMQTVIGYKGDSPGSLAEFGVKYEELPMIDGKMDWEGLPSRIKPHIKGVLIQRSRGYSMRNPLTIADIERICKTIKSINPECICFVDNCYGEFTDVLEPTNVGADLMAGSLIKNPGGGIAPTGGYIAGRADLVDQASYRMTAPGIGGELGASLSGNRLFYQGLFLAPHVTAQAVKGAIFASAFFGVLGYHSLPAPTEKRNDIIQAIELGSREKMEAFAKGIQMYSPVDAYVTPEAGDMPGYEDAVIMAAGTFVQGASIELSADGPMRPPYIIYLQGGLTLEHAMIGSMGAAEEIERLESQA